MYLMPDSSLLPYKGHFPKLGSGVFVASGARLIGDLMIGEESSIWFNVTVRADCHYIRIGKRTNVQDNTVIHVTNSRFPTNIGDDVTIGHSAVLHGCEIKGKTLIGMGAIIMDGVTIPENSIVAAGSLVTPGKSFPEGHLIMGSPAKAVRALTTEESQSLETSIRYYLEYKSHYVPHSS
ncbi:MAG: gamma carbonic anhydrase family protein [Oligoflexus sp.]